MSDAKFMGYMLPSGYFGTNFRQSWEHGGVFHVEEVDAGHPGVLLAINECANSVMAFPDGMVKKHDDFRLVMSANTYGNGATREYVGRQAIDKATKNRFITMTILYDEALETAMCHSTGLDATQVEKVLAYVRKLRKNGTERGVKAIVSPRQSQSMCDMLHVGWTWAECEADVIRMGEIDDAAWTKLTAA
jgi:cobaltochelatase CobS